MGGGGYSHSWGLGSRSSYSDSDYDYDYRISSKHRHISGAGYYDFESKKDNNNVEEGEIENSDDESKPTTRPDWDATKSIITKVDYNSELTCVLENRFFSLSQYDKEK